MKSLKLLLMVGLTVTSLIAFSQEKAGRKDTTQHIKLYTCPMHDTIALKQPENCPVCGMKLQLTKKEQMKIEVTKVYTCPMHAEEKSDKPGKCSKCGMNLILSAKEQMKWKVMNNYTCSMHNDIKSDKPRKCPKCGMTLTKIKQ